MRTALVTGATGFIGRHVVAGLLDRGVSVRALVRSPTKAAHLQQAGVETFAGTLADIAHWQTAIGGCDAVFQCAGLVAARCRADLVAVNGDAVGRLADACAAVETPPLLVHLSSLAAAGPVAHDAVRVESDPIRPVSAYGESKLVGDGALAARAGRLPVTIVRPGVVFGPHDTSVAAMFQSIQWTRLHAMMGFRSPRLSLVYVADLVSLVLDAAVRGARLPAPAPAGTAPAGTAPELAGTGIYQACDDREFPTHAELGHKLARALGTWTVVVPLPLSIAFPTAFAIEAYWNLRGQPSIVSPDKIREAMAPSWAASAARARAELGFAPAASLDDRLAETAHWLRHAGKL